MLQIKFQSAFRSCYASISRVGLCFGIASLFLSAILIPSIAAQTPQDTLSLHEFEPRSKLILPQHPRDRASYPVVDVHTHFRIRFRHDPQSLEQFIQVMDRNQIAVSCSLDGTLGSLLHEHLDYLRPHIDRFIVFANIDFQGSAPAERYELWDCNQSDFVRRTVESIRQVKAAGWISGLKVFKQLGLGYRNSDGSFLKIDDQRLDPIWEVCGQLGLPVLMHTADPSAFFDPIDRFNERFEELSRHPEWAFPADRFPSRQELHEARNRVILRHPNTTFIAAHLGNDGENLAQTAQWLDQMPNLYVEMASRISELGRQPRNAHRFLESYSDRVLFGTDGPWPEQRLQLYWRFLETDDEYFPYSEKPLPPQGLWQIDGVELSDQALQRIYFGNAERLIPGVREKLEHWRSQRIK